MVDHSARCRRVDDVVMCAMMPRPQISLFALFCRVAFSRIDISPVIFVVPIVSLHLLIVGPDLVMPQLRIEFHNQTIKTWSCLCD